MEFEKKKFQHLNGLIVFVGIWNFLAISSSVGFSGTNEDSQNLWDRIIKVRKMQTDSIQSIEVQYDVDVKFGSEDNPEVYLSKRVSYGREGIKLYQSEIGKDKITDADVSSEQTFDGVSSSSRSSDRRNMVFWKTGSPHKLATPIPIDMIEYYDPNLLNTFMVNGNVDLLSAEKVTLNKTNCIRCQFDIVDGPVVQRLEVWYDTEHGYWPVVTKRFDTGAGGNLVDEVYDVNVAKVIVAGNEHFYPKTAVRKVYENGKNVMSWTFGVIEHSIKINQDIPESKFRMEPRLGEIIYDQDLQTTLRDPGKDLDFSHLDKTAESLSSDIQSTEQDPSSRIPSGGSQQKELPTRLPEGIQKDNRILQNDPSPTKYPGTKVVLISLIAAALLVVGLLFWKRSHSSANSL